MHAVPTLDVSRVVAFVNEYADHPRAVAGEQDTPYPDAAGLLEWPGHPSLPARDALVTAANAAFRVFSAAGDGRAYERLNVLLRSAAPSPVATESGLRWTVDAPDAVLPAALATCLLDRLLDHGQDRLGTCHAANCADAYTDSSPAGHRRFCSPTCLNRHKVAAHRRRASRRPR